jgi:hypothetical protein
VQTIKRSQDTLAPLYRLVTPDIEQVRTKRIKVGGEGLEQEGMHQGNDVKQAHSNFIREDTQALKGQFGFIVVEGHFDLLAAGRDEDDVSGLIRGIDWLGGQ